MKKNTSKVDIEELKPRFIHIGCTVEEFLEQIKCDPNSIIYNFDIRFALEVLSDKASTGTHNESLQAKAILNRVGLNAFAPSDDRGRKKENPFILEFERDPYDFLKKVESIRKTIQPAWQKYKGRLSEDLYDAIKDSIEAFLKATYQPSLEDSGLTLTIDNGSASGPSDNTLNLNIDPEVIEEIEKDVLSEATAPDITKLTLSVVANMYNVPFSRLYSFYKNNKKIKQARDDLSKVFEQDSKQEKKDKPIKTGFFSSLPRNPSTENLKINRVHLRDNKHYDQMVAYQAYNEAYEWYKDRLQVLGFGLRFLCLPDKNEEKRIAKYRLMIEVEKKLYSSHPSSQN